MYRGPRSGAAPEDWQTSVVDNLGQANDAHRQTVGTIADSVLSIRRTNAECNRQRDNVHGHLSQKIRNTEELRQQLSTRIRSIRQATEHSEWSLSKLQNAHQALASPLDTCRQRLHLRQKRPKREMVFDPFQESLLSEEKELQSARSRLSDAVSDTQKLIRELKQMNGELEADMQDKQHALQIDSLCAHKKAYDYTKLDKIYSRKDTGLKPIFPEITATPRGGLGGGETEGRVQERARQVATLRTIESALRLEQAAKDRWQVSNETLDACARATNLAFKTTQADMGAKIEHTELLRQELVKQRKATEQKISDANRCLQMTMDKLAFLEKPMSANRERSKIRSQRTPREATSDEVSEALYAQQHALHGKKLQLQGQVNAIRQRIDELEQAHQVLIDDITDKERALDIDRQCASCKNTAHAHLSFGFAKVGQGQRQFSDTASSMLRQVKS